ncbi:MAG: GAF domain-containing protein [Leptolyngbya sp. PLA3]|nr:MAG: GAF domain-containing protein [Cyanobacteria bacterium CYA]MCE7967881.1 GAF domain-containing protein [Leptolyngbya sp. PL-A3]
MHRDYDRMGELLHALRGSRVDRMRAAADVLWEHLSCAGVSWVGFYTAEPGDVEMVLGPCRNKPACSPIGLHGACGQCWTNRRALVIADVAVMGDGYIACDPRDRSEVVVPLFDDAQCWGVLDVDSHRVGAFSARDAEQLDRLMVIAKLTGDGPREDPIEF